MSEYQQKTYIECEAHARELLDRSYNPDTPSVTRDRDVARAQVWATLALAAATRDGLR